MICQEVVIVLVLSVKLLLNKYNIYLFSKNKFINALHSSKY